MSLQVQISLCQSLCSDSLGIVKRLAVDSFQDIPWWLLRNFLLEKRISLKNCLVKVPLFLILCPSRLKSLPPTLIIGETKRNAEVRRNEYNNPTKSSEPLKHLRRNINHCFIWTVLVLLGFSTFWNSYNNCSKKY